MVSCNKFLKSKNQTLQFCGVSLNNTKQHTSSTNDLLNLELAPIKIGIRLLGIICTRLLICMRLKIDQLPFLITYNKYHIKDTSKYRALLKFTSSHSIK